MIGPNTPSKSNQEAGEKPGKGFVISLDETAGEIRFKMAGTWHELTAEDARGLADHFDAMDIDRDPRAYDIQGNLIGSATDRLREFADELEEADQ